MKFLFAILAIAMMIQVSMAGSMRLKRDNEVQEGLHEFLTFSKHLVASCEKSVKGALEEMPKTEAYAPLRKDLEELLEDIEKFPTFSYNCFVKTFSIIFEFVGFGLKYAGDDATDEAKIVFDLMEKHSGDDIDKEFFAWVEKYSDKKMDPIFEKMTKEEALESLKPLFVEVC